MDIRPGSVLSGPEGQEIIVGSLLGQGAFGQVFAGTMADGTSVAIKTMLTGSLNTGELESLLNEGRLAVGIDHPNVVRVLHFDDGSGDSGTPPFLVMERIDGGTLADAIDQRRASGVRFSDDELRSLFTAIADGMEAVNARLVHRDLKPSNVLLDGSTAIPKIADFGLAKLASAATRSETFKGWGTPQYISPEAWDDKANTTAMDVYAAGVMFFELATFEWPVKPRPGDPPALAWRNAHLLVAASDARKLRGDLSVDLWQLITKMLQKDPRKRPTSWAEVRAAMSRSASVNAPDVSSLVIRAAERTVAEEQAATAARESAERARERHQLLDNACDEPISMLEQLVETFNAASELGALDFKRRDGGGASVTKRGATYGAPSLVVTFQQIEDLEVRTEGIYRILGSVVVSPEPRPSQESDYYSNDSFGGFNLLYRVRSARERFGDWQQIRFEMSPMAREMRYPHWWAHTLAELPRELSLLGAIHIYQSQRRVSDHEWFKELLAHLV